MFGGSIWDNDDGRDERRSFNLSEKRAIWESQQCKCASCKSELDFFKAHFSHKKAWSAGGRTKVSNGIALCRECHGDVHDEERLNKYKSQIKAAKKTTAKKTTAKKTTAKKTTAKKTTAKKKPKRNSGNDSLFGSFFG